MGGSNRPQQQVFDPTPPAVQPLQRMLAQAFMGMAQQPQQNRNPMMGGPLNQIGNSGGRGGPGQMGGQMPPMMSIFQQLFGGGGGGGMQLNERSMQPPTAVPSGSRMMHSAPGGNMPTFSQMMMGRLR